MSKEKLKVLQIVSDLSGINGVNMVVKNYFDNINKDNVAFDIAYFIENNELKEHFQSNGANLYLYPRAGLKNTKQVVSRLKEIMLLSNCQIVHLHVPILHYYVKKAIKQTNKDIKLVLSSHNTSYSTKFLKSVRNRIMCLGITKNVDKFLACSTMAGEKYFGKAFKKNGEILYNAIDIRRFSTKITEQEKEELKKELNISNEKVYINVGRLNKQKNQLFLIDIFKEIYKKDNNSILLLVGDGGKEYQDLVEQKVLNSGIKDNIKMLGRRKDVEKLLSISHALVFPSLFEGLGLSLIESQVAEVLTFTSDCCPPETNISNIISYISLKKSANFWAEQILNTNYPQKIQVNVDNYDIVKQAKKLEDLYKNLLKNK